MMGGVGGGVVLSNRKRSQGAGNRGVSGWKVIVVGLQIGEYVRGLFWGGGCCCRDENNTVL